MDEDETPFEKSMKENLINTSTKVEGKLAFNKKMPFSFPKYLDQKINIELDSSGSPGFVEFVQINNPPASRFEINLDSILRDHRTTCMIKNIPNKFTAPTLINFINETHFGSYDFLYLRMDFKNRCNVGYAFINFTSNKHVHSFYTRINGMRWSNVKSTKVAELTYASIQGFENLVRKFKKSTIMNEEKNFRPRIFYTEGLLKGYEKPDFC